MLSSSAPLCAAAWSKEAEASASDRLGICLLSEGWELPREAPEVELPAAAPSEAVACCEELDDACPPCVEAVLSVLAVPELGAEVAGPELPRAPSTTSADSGSACPVWDAGGIVVVSAGVVVVAFLVVVVVIALVVVVVVVVVCSGAMSLKRPGSRMLRPWSGLSLTSTLSRITAWLGSLADSWQIPPVSVYRQTHEWLQHQLAVTLVAQTKRVVVVMVVVVAAAAAVATAAAAVVIVVLVLVVVVVIISATAAEVVVVVGVIVWRWL